MTAGSSVDPSPADQDGSADLVPTPLPDRESVLARWGSRGTAVVLGLCAVVLLVIGATIGLAVSNSTTSTPSAATLPTGDSVDAGFSRDMIVHHTQGVLMAHYAELDTTDPEIALLAYDINYTQTAQIGQMQGWLALWDLPQVVSGAHMTWMASGGHDMAGMSGMGSAAGVVGLMPGMATDAEVTKLKGLRGKESDIYFLQLMIRHHLGGAPMMEYAQVHAQNPVVRNFASKMLVSQTGEVQQMTGMLQVRGAQPLAYTAPTLPSN